MELSYDFEIPTNLEQAWKVLLDVPRIVPCLPGAELTETVDDTHYKGLAQVKVGPVLLKFAGEAEIAEIDNDAHSAVIKANGADQKGRGQAQANVVFALSEEAPDRTRVDVKTDLNLTGTVAQYGRATGLIDAVAKQIIADFVKNLEAELNAGGDGPAAAPPAPPQAEAQAEDTADNMSAPAAPADGSTGARPGADTRQGAKPVSGISLMVRAILSMIKGWFGRS